MSEAERAEARAEGALDNFLVAMQREMLHRSPEYIEQFWQSLYFEMDCKVENWKGRVD